MKVLWKRAGLRKMDRRLFVFLLQTPRTLLGRSLSAFDVSTEGGRPIYVIHTDRAIRSKATCMLDWSWRRQPSTLNSWQKRQVPSWPSRSSRAAWRTICFTPPLRGPFHAMLHRERERERRTEDARLRARETKRISSKSQVRTGDIKRSPNLSMIGIALRY